MVDPKIIKTARLMLTRLRVDTNTIQFHSERGFLTLSGKLQFLNSQEGRSPDLSYELLHEIHRQLSRLDGIKRVAYNLDNWSHNSDGHWTKRSKKISC